MNAERNPARRRRWPWITGGAVVAVIVAAGVIGAFADTPASNEAAPAASAPRTSPTTAAPPVPAGSTPPSNPPVAWSTLPALPANAVEKLRETFRSDYVGQPWLGKVTSIDLDGLAVIGRSMLVKGDQGAVKACEALRASATKALVDFRSVAIRDGRDRTLAEWSSLTGAAACAR